MSCEKNMTTEKSEKEKENENGNNNFNARINSKSNRDFERHGVYTPRNLNINYGQETGTKKNNTENILSSNFRFKNSLVITPYYEIEFNAVGGIKYIKNHDERVFFTNGGLFAVTNGVQKIPVLLKRGVNKHAAQKKLTVEEQYNYEEKYEIFKNIILYYDENRIDFQILFNKNNKTAPENNPNPKDITTEFSLNINVPEITGANAFAVYKNHHRSHAVRSLSVGNIIAFDPPGALFQTQNLG